MKSNAHSISFVYCILMFFGLCSTSLWAQSNGSKEFVVVLDAGHGGHDPGNLGNGFFEKNIALNIVLKAGKLLGDTKGIKIIYTRKDDTFVDLFERGEIANKANADLFVSVHCDSHSSDAHGAGTFVLGLHANKQNFAIAKKENSVIYLEDDFEKRYAKYDINSPESIIGLTIMQEEFLEQSISLAKMIQDNFTGSLNRKDRKVKQAGFIVLHQTFMPSVLVETGFLTNKNEGAFLNSTKGQNEMGTAIARAVLKYREQIVGIPAPEFVELSSSTINSPIVDKPVLIDTVKDDTEVIKEEIKKEEPPIVVVEEKQQIVKEIPVKEDAKQLVKTIPEGKVSYKVQFMASSKSIALNAANFNGLMHVTKESFNNLFRYLYGKAKNLEEAQKLKTFAIYKGYDSAYIVAYKGKERISMAEANKYKE